MMLSRLASFRTTASLLRLFSTSTCLPSPSPSPRQCLAKKRFANIHTSYTTRVRTCWSCDRTLPVRDADSLTCEACNTPQPVQPTSNYFTILGLEPSFEVTPAELSKVMIKLQMKLHPDKFTLKSEKHRAISESISALVNEANNTLRDPLLRALYLLELHDPSFSPDDLNSFMEKEFLTTMMEINEQIDELRPTDSNGIRQLMITNDERIAECESLLSEAFLCNDINRAKSIVARLKFYRNISSKLIDLRNRAY